MNDRLPPVSFEHLSAAQQVAAQAVIDGPRGALYGPFVPLIRSPELIATGALIDTSPNDERTIMESVLLRWYELLKLELGEAEAALRLRGEMKRND